MSSAFTAEFEILSEKVLLPNQISPTRSGHGAELLPGLTGLGLVLLAGARASPSPPPSYLSWTQQYWVQMNYPSCPLHRQRTGSEPPAQRRTCGVEAVAKWAVSLKKPAFTFAEEIQSLFGSHRDSADPKATGA
jgi:hypothetical protein